MLDIVKIKDIINFSLCIHQKVDSDDFEHFYKENLKPITDIPQYEILQQNTNLHSLITLSKKIVKNVLETLNKISTSDTRDKYIKLCDQILNKINII